MQARSCSAVPLRPALRFCLYCAAPSWHCFKNFSSFRCCLTDWTRLPVQESLCSLRFAAKANACEIGTAKRQVTTGR